MAIIMTMFRTTSKTFTQADDSFRKPGIPVSIRRTSKESNVELEYLEEPEESDDSFAFSDFLIKLNSPHDRPQQYSIRPPSGR